MNFPNQATICYLINENEELLLQYKRKGFGKGKWNGPGGKIETGETPRECVKREVWEETGIRIIEAELKGELEFIFPDNPKNNFYSYVFVSRKFQGDPEDTEEGELRWFYRKDLPWKDMWDDDRYWLYEVLEGNFVRKRFYFKKDGNVDSFCNIKN